MSLYVISLSINTRIKIYPHLRHNISKIVWKYGVIECNTQYQVCVITAPNLYVPCPHMSVWGCISTRL
jgi:hypothetical protein